MCKAVCLKSKERELVWQMILKVSVELVYSSFICKLSNPREWLTSLDLTQLGDLLMVLARSDWAAFKPTALSSGPPVCLHLMDNTPV